MSITKSAKKALRQSRHRAIRNLKRKEAYKKILKQIRKFITAGKTKEAAELVPQAYKALDKAAKTGVLKKNAAARRKSRLMHWITKAKRSA